MTAAIAAGATSLPALAQDASGTWALSGTVAWRNPTPGAPAKADNFGIGLCTQACLDTDGLTYPPNTVQYDAGDATNGYRFNFPFVSPATYRVAVDFSPVIGKAGGYLMRTATGYTLTTDWAKASTDIFTQSVDGASFLVNIPYTPPPPPPPPPPAPKYPKAGVSYVMLLRNNNYAGFRFTVINEQPSTVLRVAFTGCAGPKKTVYVVDLAKSKTHTYFLAPAGYTLGPNYTLTMRVSEAGKTPQTFSNVAITGVKGLVCPKPR